MPTIDTNAVYKQLKKQNGEGFARVIRDAVLLDVPNIVHVLEFAGRNADEAEQLVLVIRETYKGKQEPQYHTNKTPLELLSDAGYDAFVVHTEQEKNSIKKYYRPGEEICTLRDPQRHKKYYMIHAIKRGADKIKPSANPEREDEYGTSVISIQIAKTGGFISIKNRYNHTVNDPDNTFNSNPDQIIHGLSESLKRFFHVDFNATHAPIPSGFIIVQDQLVRYDYEINNYYFGSDYYAEGSTITKLNNDNQILFDCGFVLTVSKGKNTVQSIAGEYDFCTVLDEFLRDKKIRITVGADKRTKTILVNNERFMDITNGKITFINAPDLETIQISRQGNLTGDLDFSGVKHLFLGDANCSGITGVKLNPNANMIMDGPGLKLSGDLDFSGVKCLDLEYADLSGVRKIKFNPNADTIRIHSRDIKLSGDLDFSGVKNLNLSSFCDCSDVKSIKLNPNASSINLGKNLKLSGNLDFSGVKNLYLPDCDFSDVKSMKFNPNASAIRLVNAKNLSGSLDFGDTREIGLSGVDFSKITDIKVSAHTNLNLSHARNLPKNLDFAKAYSVDLSYTDLTNIAHIKIPNLHATLDFIKVAGVLEFVGTGYADIKHGEFTDGTVIKYGPQISSSQLYNPIMTGNIDFIITKPIQILLDGAKLTNVRFGPNASEIDISGSTLIGDMDFSSLKTVGLLSSKLDQVTSIKFNPNAEYIDLRYSTGLKLSGDLDFSKVDSLTLNSTDTSNVTSIKLNPKATVIGLTGMKLSGDLDFSHVKELYLMGSDLTNVKSITLSSSAAKWLRGQKVVINGKIVLGRNLSKYGIKVKRSNLFTDAKKRVEELKARKKAIQDKLSALKSRNIFDKQKQGNN